MVRTGRQGDERGRATGYVCRRASHIARRQADRRHSCESPQDRGKCGSSRSTGGLPPIRGSRERPRHHCDGLGTRRPGRGVRWGALPTCSSGALTGPNDASRLLGRHRPSGTGRRMGSISCIRRCRMSSAPQPATLFRPATDSRRTAAAHARDVSGERRALFTRRTLDDMRRVNPVATRFTATLP